MHKKLSIQFFSIFICCSLLRNFPLEARPPIVDLALSVFDNRNLIYATSFTLGSMFFILERVLINQREHLSEEFIPLYHEHLAYVESQNSFHDDPRPTYLEPQFNSYPGWAEFYNKTAPTKKIAKKLNSLKYWERVCFVMYLLAGIGAFITWRHSLQFDETVYKYLLEYDQIVYNKKS